MNIIINHSAMEAPENATLADVLVEHNMAGDGIAVAVDNVVVSRAKWDSTVLHENARLTVIRAVCGG